MVKLKDIAQRCDVSLATVSKALNGHSDIGPETSMHIKQVAKEMGYLPNSAARSLKTNRSYNIGVLFVDKTSGGLAHEFFSKVLNGVKEAAEARGYDITFINKNIGKLNMGYYEHARYRNCDGVIIASGDFNDPGIIKLVNSNIPCVTIDHVFNNRTSIVSDNASGLEQLVRYVYSQGHRDIAFVHGEDTSVTQIRLASYHRICRLLGLEINPQWIKSAMYHDPAASEEATKEILSLSHRPTCIIYPDDFSYVGGSNAIERMGLSIPSDISTAGYDGIFLSKEMRPRLTTYEQNAHMMGCLASENLVASIEEPESYIAQQIMVKGQLLEGETVKKI